MSHEESPVEPMQEDAQADERLQDALDRLGALFATETPPQGQAAENEFIQHVMQAVGARCRRYGGRMSLAAGWHGL